MSSKAALHLQYGVNAFAGDAYKNYRPPAETAHYPDPLASELREMLAEYTGFPKDMILCSSGSDELIDIYIRLHKLKTPGVKVAFSPPTYPQYEAYTAREEVVCIRLPHNRSAINARQVIGLGGRPENTVVMLDSPSNPSGEIISREQFIDLLEAGFQVFADEAYYEFSGGTVADLIHAYPEQLVVSRSLSKFAAMAGSRIGYLLASPEIIQEVRTQQLFFSVSSEGQHRAMHALRQIEMFHRAADEMRRTKQYVDEAIRALGAYRIHHALDMYSIFEHKHISTEELHQRLLADHAIHTARFANFKGSDVIRSTVMRRPLMQRLIMALRSYA